MVPRTRVTGSTTCEKVTESNREKTDPGTMETGHKIREKATENRRIVTDAYMKVTGIITFHTAKELSFLEATNILANG